MKACPSCGGEFPYRYFDERYDFCIHCRHCRMRGPARDSQAEAEAAWDALPRLDQIIAAKLALADAVLNCKDPTIYYRQFRVECCAVYEAMDKAGE